MLGSSVTTRHLISEVADSLAPAPRRRELIRNGFNHTLFRVLLQLCAASPVG
jgi:hypothetical protein